MTDIIVTAIVVLIVGSALAYIIRAKKRGVKCIGCSAASGCSSHSGGSASHTCCCESGCGHGCCGESGKEPPDRAADTALHI